MIDSVFASFSCKVLQPKPKANGRLPNAMIPQGLCAVAHHFSQTPTLMSARRGAVARHGRGVEEPAVVTKVRDPVVRGSDSAVYACAVIETTQVGARHPVLAPHPYGRVDTDFRVQPYTRLIGLRVRLLG